MTVTQVNLTERGENVVIPPKKKEKGLHLTFDSDFPHFRLKLVMTPEERSSLLKSCAHRSFSFTRSNLQAFATRGLKNTGLL